MTWFERKPQGEVRPFSFGAPTRQGCVPWSFERAPSVAPNAAPLPDADEPREASGEPGTTAADDPHEPASRPSAAVQLRATGGYEAIGQAANLDVETLLEREDVAEAVESKARAIADDRWASVAESLAAGADAADQAERVEVIAAAVAQLVVGEALEESTARWAHVVQSVAGSVDARTEATLRVHPDALSAVRDAMADRLAWNVEPDAELAYGDVVLETERGALVSTMQERIGRLVSAALAHLERAQEAG